MRGKWENSMPWARFIHAQSCIVEKKKREMKNEKKWEKEGKKIEIF